MGLGNLVAVKMTLCDFKFSIDSDGIDMALIQYGYCPT